MSRIGRKPVVIPPGVEVKLEGNNVLVKGPQGTLNSTIHPMMQLSMENGEVVVTRPNDGKEARSLHGLSRTIIQNMVDGVNQGFKKELEIQGVGYRAVVKEGKLILNVGYSNPVEMTPPEGITAEAPELTKIVISGISKQAVGQFAAEVRKQRPPEPYKGKGIRYAGEYVARKEGKAGKGAK